MNNESIATKMKFPVKKDLHDLNSPVYEVVIDLKKEVSDNRVREWAINIAGTAVRNYYNGKYQGLKSKSDLIRYIKNALQYKGLIDNGFEATEVNVKEKENEKTRA